MKDEKYNVTIETLPATHKKQPGKVVLYRSGWDYGPRKPEIIFQAGKFLVVKHHGHKAWRSRGEPFAWASSSYELLKLLKPDQVQEIKVRNGDADPEFVAKNSDKYFLGKTWRAEEQALKAEAARLAGKS